MLVSIVVLDLVVYAQHMAFRHVPVLWRLHRVHHADTELDVTTGLRFHPFEILLSLAIKVAAVLALGAPALAVVVFEVVLNATSMFNHSNVALPPWLDPLARWLIVAPALREVHHSGAARDEEQFRVQSAVVGTVCRHISRRSGVRRHHRPAGVSRGVERKPLRLLTQPFRRVVASAQAAEGPDR